MENVIVGIDPGTSVGICVINLKKEILYHATLRNKKISEITQEILKYGKPIIIATDKVKIPFYVKKIGKMFNAKIFSPKKEPFVEEKRKLIKELKIEVNSDHERDSIFAALMAYNKFLPLIKKIDSIEDLNEQEKEMVFQLLFSGEAPNIKEAVEIIKNLNKIEIKETKKEVLIEDASKIKFIAKNLMKENSLLKKLLLNLLEERKFLKTKLKELKKKAKKEVIIVKQTKNQRSFISENFCKIISLIENNKIPVINCDALNDLEFKEIKKIDSKLICFFSNNIKKLEVLGNKKFSKIFSESYPSFNIIKIDLHEFEIENGKLFSISKEKLQKIVKTWLKEKLKEMLAYQKMK